MYDIGLILKGFNILAMDQDKLEKRKRSNSEHSYDSVTSTPKKNCTEDRNDLEIQDDCEITKGLEHKEDREVLILEEFEKGKEIQNKTIENEIKLKTDLLDSCPSRSPESLSCPIEECQDNEKLIKNNLDISQDDDVVIIKEIVKNVVNNFDIGRMKMQLEKKNSGSYSSSNYSRNDYSKRRKYSINLEVSRNEDLVEEVNKYTWEPNELVYDDLYYCKYCDISTNSEKTLLQHKHGKKHVKKVQSEIPYFQGELFPQTHRSLSPPFECRMHEKTALIQKVAETLKNPCPALDYITEFQDLKNVYYLCNLCDSMYFLPEILSHLNDFQHKMKCLKLYDYGAYRMIHSMDKCKAEYRLTKILKDLILQYGFGEIRVEKKTLDNVDTEAFDRREESYRCKHSRQRSRYPDKDYRFSGKFLNKSNSCANSSDSCTNLSSSDEDFDSSVPRNLSNNIMWEMHNRGPRHLKNCKKPEQISPKLKSIKIPNARAKIMDQIDALKGPVVGLDDIQEIYDGDNSLFTYRCFLCRKICTSLDIINHVLSLKHREKYLRKIEYAPYCNVKRLYIFGCSKENIIGDLCEKVEHEIGRGQIEVRITDVNFNYHRGQHSSRYVKY